MRPIATYHGPAAAASARRSYAGARAPGAGAAAAARGRGAGAAARCRRALVLGNIARGGRLVRVGGALEVREVMG